MLKKFILAITCLITAGIVSAVELVKDGKPAASIILAEKPFPVWKKSSTPSVAEILPAQFC